MEKFQDNIGLIACIKIAEFINRNPIPPESFNQYLPFIEQAYFKIEQMAYTAEKEEEAKKLGKEFDIWREQIDSFSEKLNKFLINSKQEVELRWEINKVFTFYLQLKNAFKENDSKFESSFVSDEDFEVKQTKEAFSKDLKSLYELSEMNMNKTGADIDILFCWVLYQLAEIIRWRTGSIKGKTDWSTILNLLKEFHESFSFSTSKVYSSTKGDNLYRYRIKFMKLCESKKIKLVYVKDLSFFPTAFVNR